MLNPSQSGKASPGDGRWLARENDRGAQTRQQLALRKRRRAPRRIAKAIEGAAFLGLLTATPALAASFTFDNGPPDGLIGTLSQPAGAGHNQTETADDFTLSTATSLTSATFTGLLPTGTPLANITNVEIEFYHLFPVDSTVPPSGNVPTRVGSPADVEIATATRESAG